MSGSVNKVILIGNLGRDPEVRHSQDGTKVVSMSLATSESWKDRQTGERRDRTEWHRIVIFNERLADVAEKYLKKGARVFIEGQIQTRKWSDPNGQERYTTEIILPKYKGEISMLEGRGDHASEPGALSYDVGDHGGHSSSAPFQVASSSKPALTVPAQPQSSSESYADLNDEVPF